MKGRHLGPALIAIFLFLVAIAGGVAGVCAIERRYVHALASADSTQKLVGSALQEEAFRQSDLLPIYGSSEVLATGGNYHARTLFGRYPTGFTIFEVAKAGATFLIYAQDLVAAESALRGRKVVISFTAISFFTDMADPKYYAGNFSRLHANALAFSTRISFNVKHIAAGRMLKYPQTVETDPLLKLALQRLASGSLFDRLAYYAELPLGKLQVLVLRLQDHWETFLMIRSQPKLDPQVPHKAASLNWPILLANAEREQKTRSVNNPYGLEDGMWLRYYAALTKGAYWHPEREWLQAVDRSQEWNDLDLLLQIAKELGVQPLILSIPFNGAFNNDHMVGEQARKRCYEKLRQAVAPYGVPLVDFADHDDDRYFTIDPWCHTSRKGWVYVAQTLDAFYHDTLQ